MKRASSLKGNKNGSIGCDFPRTENGTGSREVRTGYPAPKKTTWFRINSVVSVLFSTLLLLLWSCSAGVPENEKPREEQLQEYKHQMKALAEKIAFLEKELDASGGGQKVRVKVTEVKPRIFEHFIEAVGIVHTDQNVMVSPEATGIIMSIEVREGQRVQKGQVLARLKTETIERSIQELEVNLALATTLYERRKNLWDQDIGSEVEFLQAKSEKEALTQRLEGLQAQQAMAVIKSPIDGVVDDLVQNQGEMAGPVIPFARVVNLDEVYITAAVAETYLNRVKAGDSVWVEMPVLELKRRAVIFRTSSVIDPDSRSFTIRINLPNRDHRLQPNLMAQLKMRTLRLPNALVVPSILVKRDFEGDFLFVGEKNGNGVMVARKRYITTGSKDNNQLVVTGGVNEGDQLITEGFAQVVEGSLLNVYP